MHSVLSICFSEFLLDHTVVEEEEGWVCLAINGVSEAKTSLLQVHTLACENLHFVEFSHDEFNHFGSSLFESINSIFLSILLKVIYYSFKVSLKHRHDILLAESHFLKLMSIYDIDNSLTILVTGSLVIS